MGMVGWGWVWWDGALRWGSAMGYWDGIQFLSMPVGWRGVCWGKLASRARVGRAMNSELATKQLSRGGREIAGRRRRKRIPGRKEDFFDSALTT